MATLEAPPAAGRLPMQDDVSAVVREAFAEAFCMEDYALCRAEEIGRLRGEVQGTSFRITHQGVGVDARNGERVKFFEATKRVEIQGVPHEVMVRSLWRGSDWYISNVHLGLPQRHTLVSIRRTTVLMRRFVRRYSPVSALDLQARKAVLDVVRELGVMDVPISPSHQM